MGRRLRYVPEGRTLFEITTRTVQGRFLLRPGPQLNRIILGILGRAQRRYGVELHAFVFLSNHYHLLATVQSAHQLALFVGYLNANLAKEAGRLHGWREKFWSRRYQAIPVSEEEAAQLDRLRYVLSHGAKEGLVRSPRDWPGVHSIDALLGDSALKGLWFSRTREYAARQRGEEFNPLEHAETERVTLTPLPCFRHLDEDPRRARINELVAEIEATARQRYQELELEPLGRRAIQRQEPTARPNKIKKASAPLVHAATKRVRRAFFEAYHTFVATYRQASERLLLGDTATLFPEGCFLPSRPALAFARPG